MSFRPLLLAAPAVLMLAFASPAPALDDSVELAQAAPPAGGVDRPHGERSFSPKAMCQEQAARRIGNRAYIKARLELKPDQMGAWNAFEKAADEASTKAMARCASLPAEMKDRPDYVERLTMHEDAMKARIASIEAVKPTLTALYAVLTPEQKALFDRPRSHMAGMMGGHRHGHGPR